MLLEEKTSRIIKCFYQVYNKLGFGFLEKVYQNALMIELTENGFECVKQKPIEVLYKEYSVGDYYADIIIDHEIILELKAAESICEDEFQLINYLKATNIEVGLLLNFGKAPQFKRKIFTNDRKQIR